jgi:hypothetical protein
MKNIILQHFHPQYENVGKPMPWIVEKSSANLKRYAESLGAEYKMLDGHPFRKNLRAQCQKLCAFNEEYDEYDVVAVFDTDMFVVNGCTENIFEAQGIGTFPEIHKTRVMNDFKRAFPILANPEYPILSGSAYSFPREFRQLMRAQINAPMEKVFEMISPKPFVDEGILHVLMQKAKFKLDKYLDDRWSYSSFLHNLEQAYIIHARYTPHKKGGPVDMRDVNCKKLMDTGIIQ